MSSGCHTTMLPGRGVHAPVAQHACQTCHAPDSGTHAYPLLFPKDQLCVTCHDTGARHIVEHKAMTPDACLACHDPHASAGPALLTRGSTTQTCLQCHPRPELPVLHAPYATDRCEVCHDPHGSDTRSLLLAKSTTDSCRTCHPQEVSRIESAQSSHRSVKGDCVGCHSPHAAPAKGLLSAPLSESCLGCHNDVGKTVSGAAVSHEPVIKGERCVRCHDPHASDHRGMLRQKQQDLCLSCHSKPQTSASGKVVAAMTLPDSTHASPSHEDCAGCHSVHGANHQGLLRAASPALPLGPYDSKNYALCFSCHDPKLADLAAATQFRDGDRNLHQAHLRAGERSRGCSACHDAHATDRPMLIAENVRFEGSNWAMSMGFVKTPDGGRCGAGCHEPLSYSRSRPSQPPATPKNGGAP